MGLVNSTIASVKTRVGPCICIEGNSGNNSSGEENDNYNTDSSSESDTKDNSTQKVNILEFQHSSSSGSAEEPIPSSIEDVLSKAKSDSLIPESTKIIIYLCNLIANIMKEYFESPANQCEFNPINIAGILSNILITGDIPRNYLLNIAMNNTVDIIINTRQLTKIHLNHLQTYHSTKEQQMKYSQCILWHHYLNKFQNDINNINNKNDINSYEFISKSSYILNTKFITSILVQSIPFENKLSVYYNPNITNGYNIQIIDTIDNCNHNLDSIYIHIFDLKHKFYKNICDKKKNNKIIKKYHLTSRKQLIEFKKQNKTRMMDYENKMHIRMDTRRIDENNYISKSFYIPKYKYKLSKIIMDNYNISLNFFILPLSNIIDCTCDTGMNITETDFDWKQKITNGVENYNSFNDLKKQIITHPNIDKIIKIYTPKIFFFDIICMSLQCVQYTIDEKLIKITKANYKNWILNENFSTDEANYFKLLKTLFDEKLCCSWLDFKTMLEKFQLFNFNQILIQILNKSIDFKEAFVDKLNEQDHDVVDLFEEYNYPID